MSYMLATCGYTKWIASNMIQLPQSAHQTFLLNTPSQKCLCTAMLSITVASQPCGLHQDGIQFTPDKFKSSEKFSCLISSSVPHVPAKILPFLC